MTTTFYTLLSVGRKKLSVCQNNFAAFSCYFFKEVVTRSTEDKCHITVRVFKKYEPEIRQQYETIKKHALRSRISGVLMNGGAGISGGA